MAGTQAGPSTEDPVPFPRVGLSHKHLRWTCVWLWRSAVRGVEGLLCLHLDEIWSVRKECITCLATSVPRGSAERVRASQLPWGQWEAGEGRQRAAGLQKLGDCRQGVRSGSPGTGRGHAVSQDLLHDREAAGANCSRPAGCAGHTGGCVISRALTASTAGLRKGANTGKR